MLLDLPAFKRRYSQVLISDPVYSMGDYDRDGDVDAKDYAAIETCAGAGTPLPALCEILDFDRDNDVDKDDAKAFYAEGGCFTGGGGSTPLAGMGNWSLAVMTSVERTQVADDVVEASQGVGQQEAQVMQDYADMIDPQ